MLLLLLIQSGNPSDWKEVIQYGPTVILLALILWFLLRALPIWKEVKLAELNLRGEENQAKMQQADALGRLAEVLKDIAVEQRRATENIEISQRVNARSAEQLSREVDIVTSRMEQIENKVSAISPTEIGAKAS